MRTVALPTQAAATSVAAKAKATKAAAAFPTKFAGNTAPLKASLKLSQSAARKNATIVAAAASDEIDMLKKMLKLAEERAKAPAPAPAAPAGGGGDYSGAAFNVKTYNAISPVGLNRFPAGKYAVGEDHTEEMAIMLRSYKLKVEEVPSTVRCIARCGAGTNNIPVAEMTEKGIPVFNTPGANANAVKELSVWALLAASRGIVEGNKHVNEVIVPEEKEHAKIATRIEKDKAKFVGCEIEGKTLGVIGLGQIGGRVVNAALGLGMKVVGYDPVLSLEAALSLPGDRMERVTELDDLFAKADYISIHVPYIKGVTHHLINADALSKCKPSVSIINFARGEIVDGAAMKNAWDSGYTGKYISDFADEDIQGHPKLICLPHLGASTEEAEENSAAMAAETIKEFLEQGTIRNSVNFPTTILPPKSNATLARICIAHKNEPGALGQITTLIGNQGINISQQINTSRGDIAYTVLDCATSPEDPAAVQAALVAECPSVISSRFLGSVFADDLGEPGKYFKVTWAEDRLDDVDVPAPPAVAATEPTDAAGAAGASKPGAIKGAWTKLFGGRK